MRFALVILAVLFATAAHADRKVALVIASDDYKVVRPLKNAVNDGRAVQDALEKLGFEVFSETNRDLRRMRRALEDFREDGKGADVALVYFSGHGVELAGDNRLLPIDADATSLEKLKETTLPLEEIREAVVETGRVGLVILDACRNDPYGLAAADGTRGAAALAPEVEQEAKPGLGRMGKAENVLFAFAASPGETALDGSGANSPFTTALAKYVGTDGLEFRSVLTLVQQEVYDVTRGRQLPYVESGLPTLFFATADKGTLPERERLLLAMADVTPDLRDEIERLAGEKDIPLAPLYGALLAANLEALPDEDRQGRLNEAAAAFIKAREDLKTLAAADPEVERLRREAETQMALGAFARAHALLADAAAIDAGSSDALAGKLVARRVSEAASMEASAGVALAQLDYPVAIDAYERAAALHRKIEDEAVPDRDRRTRVWLLASLGDLHVRLGSTGKALDAFRRMEGAAKRRLADSPGSDDAIRDLSNAMLRISDMLQAQGDIAGALALLEENLSMRSRQRERMDGNADWLTGVGNITERIGDINRQKQDLDGALKYYEATLMFRRWLVEHYGRQVENREGLVSILGRMASVRYDKGDFAGAETVGKERLDVARRLVADFPERLESRFRLFDTLLSLADAWLPLAKADDARPLYQEVVTGARTVVEKDPKLARAQNYLAQGLKGLAWTYYSASDRPTRLATFGEALAVMDGLTAQDPENVQWRLYRARIQSDIGSTHYNAGSYQDAIRVLEDSLTSLRALAASRAADRDVRLALMYTLLDLGRSQRMLDENENAARSYAEAAGIGRGLDLVHSADKALRGNFSTALYNLGVLYQTLGRQREAAEAFTEKLAIIEAEAATGDDFEHQREMLDLHVHIARLSDDPRPHLEAAVAIAEALDRDAKLGAYDADPAELRQWLARIAPR